MALGWSRSHCAAALHDGAAEIVDGLLAGLPGGNGLEGAGTTVQHGEDSFSRQPHQQVAADRRGRHGTFPSVACKAFARVSIAMPCSSTRSRRS